MGADLATSHAVARSVFEEADDALGFRLSQLCWEGPESDLVRTENTQPALLTHSIAAWRALAESGVEAVAAAGHSLGEFSAHVAAGSLAFDDAVRLVRARGEAMAGTGRERPGAMAAILGLDEVATEALCDEVRGEGEVLTPANYNAPGQIVISGSVEAIDRAVETASERGARRVVRLNVSGAFHSPLMKPARERLGEALEAVTIQEAKFPVVANVDAVSVTAPEAIRERLLDQLTAPVRWVACVRRLKDLGATTFLEVGTGKVLTGLLRRIDRELTGRAVGTSDQIEEEVRRWQSA